MKKELNAGAKVAERLTKMVKVRVVSSRGHDEWEDLPEIALGRIKDEATGGKKWLYMDGKPTNPETLTLDQLLDAEYIILTNVLVGGNNPF